MTYIEKIQKENQNTIQNIQDFSGIDPIHGGEVHISLEPAPENTGIVFIVDNTAIQASIGNILETGMHITTLSKDSTHVFVTEHILSALYGLCIDNIIIRIHSGNTVPLLDGSSREFISILKKAGIRPQKDPRKYLRISRPKMFHKDGSFAFFNPLPNFLRIKSIIDFPNEVIRCQEFDSFIDTKTYVQEVAPARTFFHKPYTPERWEKIRKMYTGIPESVNDSPVIAWNEEKFLHTLRFTNEPARHKVLDFLGDISLTGYHIEGSITLYKPSHAFNRLVAKSIIEDL